MQTASSPRPCPQRHAMPRIASHISQRSSPPARASYFLKRIHSCPHLGESLPHCASISSTVRCTVPAKTEVNRGGGVWRHARRNSTCMEASMQCTIGKPQAQRPNKATNPMLSHTELPMFPSPSSGTQEKPGEKCSCRLHTGPRARCQISFYFHEVYKCLTTSLALARSRLPTLLVVGEGWMEAAYSRRLMRLPLRSWPPLPLLSAKVTVRPGDAGFEADGQGS